MLQSRHYRIVRGDMFLSILAALPRRNWRAVRAGLRMSKKCADLVGRFRGKNVLELARLLLDLRLAVERQAVSEQTFGEPVTANNVGCSLPPTRREGDYKAPVTDRDAGRF